MPRTSYLTRASLAFLDDLARHNDKEWFDANRARFEEEVKAPALRLIADLAPAMKRISPHFVVDPRPNNGSLSRMHRDVRFSKDKRPFKTALFVHFWHDSEEQESAPGFFLHVEPGGTAVGGGVWRPPPPALKAIRDAIVASPAAWKKANAGGVVGAGCNAGGESLKRVPPGYDPDHPCAEDLKRKDFGLHVPLPDKAVVGADSLAAFEDGLRRVAPQVRFLAQAMGMGF